MWKGEEMMMRRGNNVIKVQKERNARNESVI